MSARCTLRSVSILDGENLSTGQNLGSGLRTDRDLPGSAIRDQELFSGTVSDHVTSGSMAAPALPDLPGGLDWR